MEGHTKGEFFLNVTTADKMQLGFEEQLLTWEKGTGTLSLSNIFKHSGERQSWQF